MDNSRKVLLLILYVHKKSFIDMNSANNLDLSFSIQKQKMNLLFKIIKVSMFNMDDTSNHQKESYFFIHPILKRFVV